MDDRLFAKHLRKPDGNVGKAVGLIMNGINKTMNLFTYQKMNISKNDKILEIGFGNGAFISRLFDYDNDILYTGVEISDVMINEAKNNFGENLKHKVVLKKANSNSMDFDNASFNKVCTINTLYFWKEPVADLGEIYRVLETGGDLYISIRSKEAMQKNNFTQYYFAFYTFEEIKELLKMVGFINITVDNQVESESKLDFMVISCKK